ncbi:phage holin family protein [Providencia vermicola]|uniref:phage holin family protein n=1 Tax=Providencia TaxID=586 RepID=UPI0022B67F8F|nr:MULTISPECIES: phage holin family protein [unclassified Providencia]WBA55730.1 phage holin family protein [Providencia sp. 21OH12SH02B-Prov]
MLGTNQFAFLSGVTLATFIAFVRERREGNTTRQSFAEAVLCGVLTVGAIRTLEWGLIYMGFSDSWSSLAEFCGAMVGFLGTKKLSRIIDAVFMFIKNKFGVNR